MAPEHPELSAEVIDLIIDQVHYFKDRKERSETLGSIALASRDFKHRAHSHLFANIMIRQSTPSPAQRVRQLSELIEADLYSDATGIASYIKILDLHFLDDRHFIDLTKDGTFCAIFSKVFKRNTDGPVYELKISYLSMIFGPGGRQEGRSWTYMNAEFRSAFQDICCNPNLATLHLPMFVSLPPGFLHGSRIRNLTVLNTYLANRDNHGSAHSVEITEDVSALDHNPVGMLESVTTDHSLSILDLFNTEPQHNHPPRVVFPRLTSLTLNIKDLDGYLQTHWMVSNSQSSLLTLEIRIQAQARNVVLQESSQPRIIALPSLKRLHISENIYLATGIAATAFCSRFGLLPRVEEVTVTLRISINEHLHPPGSTTSHTVSAYEQLCFGKLDAFFNRTRFKKLKCLSLFVQFDFSLMRESSLFNYQHFQEESKPLIENMFPEVSMAGIQFDIYVIAGSKNIIYTRHFGFR